MPKLPSFYDDFWWRKKKHGRGLPGIRKLRPGRKTVPFKPYYPPGGSTPKSGGGIDIPVSRQPSASMLAGMFGPAKSIGHQITNPVIKKPFGPDDPNYYGGVGDFTSGALYNPYKRDFKQERKAKVFDWLGKASMFLSPGILAGPSLALSVGKGGALRPPNLKTFTRLPAMPKYSDAGLLPHGGIGQTMVKGAVDTGKFLWGGVKGIKNVLGGMRDTAFGSPEPAPIKLKTFWRNHPHDVRKMDKVYTTGKSGPAYYDASAGWLENNPLNTDVVIDLGDVGKLREITNNPYNVGTDPDLFGYTIGLPRPEGLRQRITPVSTPVKLANRGKSKKIRQPSPVPDKRFGPKSKDQ